MRHTYTAADLTDLSRDLLATSLRTILDAANRGAR